MTGGTRWIGIGLLVVGGALLAVWALLQAPALPRPAATDPQPVIIQRPGSQASPAPPRLPPVRVEGTAIVTVDQQGRPQWDIRAEVVAVRGDARTVTMTSVEGTYFEAGEPSVSFAAPRGSFFMGSRNLTLEGGARARAVSGRALSADTVTWSLKAKQIEAAGNVVFHQEGMVVRADRLRADTALRNATLSGNIRVTVAE
jgi:LPS export ABC transporter protein LptC